MANESELELQALAEEEEAQALELELSLQDSVMTNPGDDGTGKVTSPDDPLSTLASMVGAGAIQGTAAGLGTKLAGRPFQALESWGARTIPKVIGGLSGAALVEKPAEAITGAKLGPFDTLLNAAGGMMGGQAGSRAAETFDNPASITSGPQRAKMAAKIDPQGKLLSQSLEPRMGEFTDRLSIETSFKNAQRTGYLSDVNSIDELIAKIKRDVGEGIKEDVLDPQGNPLKNKMGGAVTKGASKDGLLGKELQTQVAKISKADNLAPLSNEEVIGAISANVEDLKKAALATGNPQEIEAIENTIASLSKGFSGEGGGTPRTWDMANLHESRKAFDAKVSYDSKNPLQQGSVSARINKRIADTLRNLEDSRAKTVATTANDPSLYNDWLDVKSRFQVAQELRDAVVAQGVRELKKDTGGNQLKNPSIDPSSLWRRALDRVFPKVSNDMRFKRSQVASGLRGNPAPDIRFSEISKLAAARKAGNELGGSALGGAGAGAFSAIASPEEAQAMSLPSLSQGRFSRGRPQVQPGKVTEAPQFPPLPRDTSQWNDMAVASLLVQTRQMGAEGVGYKLADAYKKAEKLGNKLQQEKIVADMSKLFPQFFESGMGVNGKLFHPDDQKEYMSKLESAERNGFVDSVFLAKQRNAFLDQNNLRILPIESHVAGRLAKLPKSLRPELPTTTSGARVDPY